MKKTLLFLFAMLLLTPAYSKAQAYLNQKNSFVIAKSVKLGRTSMLPDYAHSSLNDSKSKSEFAKDCGKNCTSCNTSTGQCSVCAKGYYLDNNKCTDCPSNATCDNGVSFICNSSYYKSGSNCVGICTGVSCLSGFSPTASADKCCCSQ